MKVLFCYRFALLEVRRTSVAALLSEFIILCWGVSFVIYYYRRIDGVMNLSLWIMDYGLLIWLWLSVKLGRRISFPVR